MKIPYPRGLSPEGLFLATVFLALSLTPSLVPRGAEVQGALGGVAAAAGHVIWKTVAWIWCWLDLPVPASDLRRRLRQGFAVAALLILGLSAWRAADWQNSVREVWDLPSVETISLLTVGLLAVVVSWSSSCSAGSSAGSWCAPCGGWIATCRARSRRPQHFSWPSSSSPRC